MKIFDALPVKSLLFLGLCAGMVMGGDSISFQTSEVFAVDMENERPLDQAYLSIATGELQTASAPTRYAWPFQFQSIGWNNATYQSYGSGPYFHTGIDMRAPAGTKVYTPSGGKIVNIENYTPGNALYWEVAVLDPEGFIWQFHHIDKNTIPQAIYNAFNSGQPVPANTHIGNIVTWPNSACSEVFHHIHLNILDAQKNYLNPFMFLTPLPDVQAPEIQEIGLMVNRQKYGGTQVSQAYGVYVRARDLIMHSCYYVTPHDIEYTLDGSAPVTVWRFDNLPGGGDNKAFINDFYVPSYTCGDYTCRNYYIDLGFTPQGPRTFPAASGQHTITVTVRDFVGNQTSKSFTWTVQDVPVEVYSENFESDKGWVRNPFGTDNATLGLWERANPEQTTNGSVVSQLGTTAGGSYDLVTGPLAGSGSGSYDVDGGITSIRSPQIDLPVSSSITFTCKYYLSHGTNSSTDDFLRVKIVGAATTTILEERGGTENDGASWLTRTYSLNSYSGQSVYFLMEAADNAGASLLEAAVDDIVITALISNNKPVVNAGPDQNITLPADATISGTVTDDGKPNPPGTVTAQWSQISGPDQAVFADVHSLTTTVSFPQSGVYQLRLVGFDGELSSSDDITITVAPVPVNQYPSVNAGTDFSIMLPAQATLTGTASDDGLPNPPGSLTILWSVVGGPGTVLFSNASALNTQASFTEPGTYQLQLAAYDGEYTGTDNVTVTVRPYVPNNAPAVDAGSDQTVTLPATAQLYGTVTDDGLPNPPGSVALTWSKISGNGTVSFTNGTILNPRATFSQQGVYILRLTASDGELSAYDDVTITVNGPVTVFSDDFETNQGWIVNPGNTDNATIGKWERGNPAQTTYNGLVYQQGTTPSGSYCLVTGALAGNDAGNYDLDGGVTTVRSPSIILPSSGTVTLSFKYYLSHANNSGTNDYLRVKVVGSTTTTVLQELGAADYDAAAWQSFSGTIGAFAGQTVYLLIEAADMGTASLLEAAVDDVMIVSE